MSRFTKNEKWFIVGFTAFVGFFSPLTANIYFPAIPTISQAFGKSTELINLTVTMYIVLQGMAPMLWGPVSDHVGRRPISAACLLILSLSCVGLARVSTSDYWLLMLLRCLQATGSASTIAIGAGVVGDISTRAERGGFFGLFTVGPMVGPAIGPVIGGLLSDHLGWRSIFWFLCISASVCFIVIILFQPETLRPIVESNKYQELSLIYRPVIPIIGQRAPSRNAIHSQIKVPKNPFRLFLNVDVDILLATSAVVCAVFYGVISTISSLFVVAYPSLTQTTIGLCFLAIGCGMTFGSVINGRVLDIEYRRFRGKIEALRSAEKGGQSVDINREENFPLEMARLRVMPLYVILMVAACAGNGWCIQRRVSISVPLILQFIVGYTSISVMNGVSTLMIDLVPGQSSSVTACNNFIRCSLSAVIVSVVEPIINAIGMGWTYILLSGICLLSLPLIYLAIRIGPRYRVKRQRARELEQTE
ncbi:MFS general substrate transporter [Agrocybe pediades]|nr:MFS general substrate transporter [Agrocybe pediades]